MGSLASKEPKSLLARIRFCVSALKDPVAVDDDKGFAREVVMHGILCQMELS